MALFLERARARRPDFSLTPQNAPAVVTICRRLEGLPLAIELAAAQMGALPPGQVTRLLDDALRLLGGGSRTELRQETLRGTLDWSYALLNEGEQALLRRLAVFAGGFDLDAVEGVCSGGPVEQTDVPRLTTALVEKSLVLYEQRDGEGRYRLLEMIREYGREELAACGEADALRARHARFFLALAETAQRELALTAPVRWLDRLEREHDNLRAALDWSTERGEVEAGLRLGSALAEFWRNPHAPSPGRSKLAGSS